MRLFDKGMTSRAGSYLFQCGLMTASLVVILFVESAFFRAAIVAAIASTAFTVFAVPNSVAATPRKVVGGHVVAVVTGSLASGVVFLGDRRRRPSG